MDKLTRQFFGDAKKVVLHPSEKAQVWDQISMRASSSPVKLSSLEKAESFAGITRHMQRNPLKVQKHPLQHFFALHRVGAMAMCAVLLMGAGGGGAVYAAEDAMPEDILYPVKLHVNERFMGAMHRERQNAKLSGIKDVLIDVCMRLNICHRAQVLQRFEEKCLSRE